jgi:hypothetical protein
VRLITAHRILIGAGIGFSVFYALFQGRRFLAVGGAAALVQAVAAVAVAGVLAVYYRSLRGWGRR